MKIQKQQPEVFYKKLLLKNKQIQIHRKTPLLESLLNSEYCEIFKSTYFEEHLRTAASENVFMKLGKNNVHKEFLYLY